MIWASVNLDFLIALFLEDAEVSIFRLSLQRGSLRTDRAPVVPFKAAAWTLPVRQRASTGDDGAPESAVKLHPLQSEAMQTPTVAAIAALAARFSKKHCVASVPLGRKAE